MTPITYISPHLMGDIAFDKIVQELKDLTILAKQYQEPVEDIEEPFTQREIQIMIESVEHASRMERALRTPQKTPEQTIHGDLQAAALRLRGGFKVFHFYWTGNLNDTELVHLFIEFSVEPPFPNATPQVTMLRDLNLTFEHNMFYSLSKQEARRIWDLLIECGLSYENGVRKLGVTTLIKPDQTARA